MPDKSSEFRRKLLDAQEITPALREACHKEINTMLHNTLTPRWRIAMVAWLVVLVALTIGGVYRIILGFPQDSASSTHNGLLHYGVAITATVMCAGYAVWVAGVLLKKKTAWKSYFRMSDVLMGFAGILTTLALLQGMQTPSNPASTFTVLLMVVFLGSCSAMSMANRIASAELAAREQMLRMECRLADIAERLKPAD